MHHSDTAKFNSNLKTSRSRDQKKFTLQLTERVTPAIRRGQVSTEDHLCSKLTLASTISTDLTTKDLLLVDHAVEQAKAEEQSTEQAQVPKYVFDDIDSLICQILTINECIDDYQLQLYLYYIYGFYLEVYAGKSETKMVGKKLIKLTYPERLFPATFITGRFGIAIMEVFSKIHSGYYVSNVVTRRAPINKQAAPYIREMWSLITGTLPDFLHFCTPIKASSFMRFEQAFKENYDPETKVGNILTDEDILRSTIVRTSSTAYSISAWKNLSDTRL